MVKVSAQETYVAIRKTYGAYWPDSEMEKNKAIVGIENALKNNISVDVLLAKAKAAAEAHQDKKCKVSTLVIDEFWDITYPSEKKPAEIKLRRYNPFQV